MNNTNLTSIKLLYFCICGMVILGILNLSCYIPGLEFIENFSTIFIPMAPFTAICFIILGIIQFSLNKRCYISKLMMLTLLTTLVIVISIFNISNYITNFNFEHIVIPHLHLFNKDIRIMSPISSILFIFSGISILCYILQIHKKKWNSHLNWLLHLLGYVIIIFSSISCLSYIWGNSLLYGKLFIIPMALISSITFIMLGLSIILSYNHSNQETISSSIIQRLILSFGLLISIMIGFGLISYNGINNISLETRHILKKPIYISTEVLKINIEVNNINDNIRYASLIHNDSVLDYYINRIKKSEKKIHTILDNIDSEIVTISDEGEKILSSIRLLMHDWEPIRTEVISSIENGDIREVTILKLEKSILHSSKLETYIYDLMTIKQKQAHKLLENSEKNNQDLVANYIMFLLITIILIIIITINTVNKIRVISTNQQNDRNKLKEGEEKFRFITENSVDIIWQLDMDFIFTYVSPNVKEYVGYTQEEWIGTNFKEHTSEKEFSRMFTYVNDTLKKNKIHNNVVTETIMIKKNGETLPVDIIIKIIKDNKGISTGIQGSARDISERKLAEKVLRESENRMKLIIDTSPIGICTVNLFGNFVITNTVYERMVGYTSEELSKLTFYDITHPDDHLKNKQLFEAMCSLKNNGFTIEKRYIRKDGEIIDVSVNIVGVFDEDGCIKFGTAFVEDITEKKIAEKKLKIATDRLEGLFLSIGSGIAIYNYDEQRKDLVFTDFNPAGEKISGYKKSDVIGKTIDEMFPNATESGIKSAIIETYKTGKSIEINETLYKDNRISGIYRNYIFKSKTTGEVIAIYDDVADQLKTKEALKRSEKKFKSIFNEIAVGVATTTINGHWLETNNALYDMLGYTEKEFSSKSIKDITHPDDLHNDVKLLNQLLRDEIKTYSFEKRYIKKNGDVIWVNITTSIMRDDNVNEYIIKVIDDITERKLNEQSLRDSEQRFKALHNASFGGIAIHDKGVILACNLGLSEMTGYSELELIGMDGLLLISEDYRDIVMDKIISGYEKSYEVKGLQKNGNEFPLRLEARNIPYNGKSARIVEFRDMTTQKNTEDKLKQSKKELQDSEEFIRSVMNNLPIGVAVNSVYPTFKFNYMNDSFPKHFHTTREQLEITDNFWDAVFEDEEYRSKIKDLIISNCTSGDVSLMHWNNIEIKKNGTIVAYVNIANIPFKDSSVMISTVIDVTKQTLMEEEKHTLEKRLQQSQKLEAIGTLSGGISHEFNNILSPILGYSEIILGKITEDSPLWKGINVIYSCGLRAKLLVEQILTFSRLGECKTRIMKIQIPIREAIQLIRSTIPANITIETHIDDNCGYVNADTTQMHQIIINLCNNAHHAMFNNVGKIIIKVEEILLDRQYTIIPEMMPGKYVLLTVSDNGCGMTKETSEKIFDPFFTTKGKGIGTGMGLSVVHGIVVNMKGTIKVYSELGKGTEFRIYFPIVDKHKAISLYNPIDTINIVGGTEHVFLLDDEKDIVDVVRMVLEHLGYTVTSFTDPVKALENFKDHFNDYDIVISDIAMPELTGTEFAKEVSKINHDIPILLCTGFSENMQATNIKKNGIKALLVKPVKTVVLANTVRKILDDGFINNNPELKIIQ